MGRINLKKVEFAEIEHELYVGKVVILTMEEMKLHREKPLELKELFSKHRKQDLVKFLQENELMEQYRILNFNK